MTDTAAVTAPVAAPAATAPVTDTPAASPWGELPDNLKAVVANKGWKSPADAAKSYDELFRFVGADKAGRGLVLPDPSKATPEEIAAFRSKAASVAGGVPDKPEGYEIKLPDDFPDPEFAGVASAILHKRQIPKADAQALMADFTAQVMEGHKAQAAAEAAENKKQDEALRAEWGVDYEKKVEIARRAVKALDAPDGVIDLIDDHLRGKGAPGTADVVRWFAGLGEKVGEGKFIDGGSDGGNFAESHETLVAQRAKLYADKAWADRYWANDATTRNEMAALEAKIAAARKRA
jgi:hypothetical protein